MNASVPLSSETESHSHFYHRYCRSVSWPAIFAGLSAAIALQLLFTLLGAGLGFALYNPISDENPIADLGKGAVIIHGISAVLSLWFGGWVAGRFTPAGVRASAWLHGFLVWTTATVAGIVIVSLGAGWIMGDISKLVGGGLSAAGKPMAAMTSSMADMAKDAAKQSGDTVSSFVDEALGTRALTAPRDENIRAKREISMTLASLFNPMNDTTRAEKRAAAIKTLDEYANLNEAEATRTVDGWIASYDRMKAEFNAAKEQAEAKARVAAEKAADALAIFSFCAFAAFVLGAFAASCGGCHGAKCARRYEESTVVVL
jgi:hypothetical protein